MCTDSGCGAHTYQQSFFKIEMFDFTNYYQQSKGLPAQNGSQLMVLQWADSATLVREISKSATVAGLVVSAASLIFSFDPTTALTMTAILGIIWGVSHLCANKLEPQAQDMVKYFKELKEEKNHIPEDETRRLGLID